MKKPPLDVAAASRICNSLRLRDVVCVRLQAGHIQSLPAANEVTLSWDTPNVMALWELDDSGLKVLIPFTLVVEGEQGGEKRPTKTKLAEFSVSLRLDYDIDRSPKSTWSEDDIPDFVGISGYLHAWPYFRAEIQWLTAKLGFPPLVLPTIVSGHAANQVTVRRMSEIAGAPAAAPRTTRKRKAKARSSK